MGFDPIPLVPQTSTLPIELQPPYYVAKNRIELLTSGLWDLRSNQLSYFAIQARVERLELPAYGFGDHRSANWATPVFFEVLIGIEPI